MDKKYKIIIIIAISFVIIITMIFVGIPALYHIPDDIEMKKLSKQSYTSADIPITKESFFKDLEIIEAKDKLIASKDMEIFKNGTGFGYYIDSSIKDKVGNFIDSIY